MQLHLFRHGTAEGILPGGSDSARKLTAAGREEVRRVSEGVRPANVAPSIILSSPYARAVETAEIAAGVLGYAGHIMRTSALEPLASPQGVWEEIRKRKNEQQIMLAGHEPLLSQLAAYLLSAPTLQIEMRTAAIVRIDLDRFSVNSRGILKWILPPDLWGV
jgi:phosphohistidine phosphatase